MKRLIAGVLVVLTLMFCGCTNPLSTGGTLGLSADDFDHIVVINTQAENTISITERKDISTVISHLNSYILEDPQEPANGNRYDLKLVYHLQGGAELVISISDSTVTYDGAMYTVNAKALGQYLEGLECANMTDRELIRYLFENNTMEELGITDESGSISIDKIANLKNACPALFELLSRSTMIESIAQYGTEIMSDYVDSSNAVLREQAEAIANFLKETFPQLAEQIDKILEEK